MFRTIIYILVGYVSGSILYARLFCHLFKHDDFMEKSGDKNPGTTNAFLYGGVLCGSLTLIGDLLKGVIPVFLYVHNAPTEPSGLGFALVIAAPVIGHIFPIFHHFKGGKGIATTFGCMLGLLPNFMPLGVLAFTFLFFSLILKISPDFYKTIVAFISASVLMFFKVETTAIAAAFLIITVVVCVRLFLSEEEKEKLKVRLLLAHKKH